MEEIEDQGAIGTRIFNWPGCRKTVFHHIIEPGPGNRPR